MLRNVLRISELLSLRQGWNQSVGQSILKMGGSACNILASRLYATGLVGVDAHYAGTMAEVKTKIMTRLGLEMGYTPVPKSREHLLKYQPKAEDLEPRSMEDSFTSAIIPLKESKSLQDRYVALLGHVRLGRLMEDMDLFAVWVCHQHLKMKNLPEDVHLPYTFVTILVDKVQFTDFRPTANEDIRLSGHVSWVGKSSMEVVVWLEQLHNGELKRITRALFVMGARNATNTGSAPVNPLSPASEYELGILSGGLERKKQRQKLQDASVFKVEPNDFEQTIMYKLFRRTTPDNTMELNLRVLPPNCRWMSNSFVTNTMPTFPENRNAHNTIFGGFLMRNALEISWVAANLYCRGRPKFESICDISFEKPVSVKSFLKITSYVVYTEMNYITMMTVCDIIDAATGNQVTSNVFYFTLSASEEVPEVLPKSYHETMWYIQGRRKFRYSLGIL